MTDLDRYTGSLVGLAIGDALGTTLEFTTPETYAPITDMVGGGPFRLEPGQWTDDTSMALCLAESLVECQGFDAHDQMRRYVRYWREGYRSSRPGACFDIGVTVRQALQRFERTGDPYSGSTDARSAGNGSLMRLAPVPLFFALDPAASLDFAAASSRTTHGAADAVDACRYLAALISGVLRCESKETLCSEAFARKTMNWDRYPPSLNFKGLQGDHSRTATRVAFVLQDTSSTPSKPRCGPFINRRASKRERCWP